MRKGSPRLAKQQLEYLRRALRELVAEDACSWWNEQADEDVAVDDEWIDWVETYEDALDALCRIGIDPYEEPMEWAEFLDPLGGFEPSSGASSANPACFLDYLTETYGPIR